MSVASELNRLIQAKNDLASSLAAKGVTVPSSATLDDYAALVDSIPAGGGGSISATITNPINNGFIGTPSTSGVVTHQYQVSSGTIVNSFLVKTPGGYWGTYDLSSGASTNNFNLPYNRIGIVSDYYSASTFSGCDATVEISQSGLLTVNYNRSQSEVNSYNWSFNDSCMVCLILDSGYFLYDTIKFYYGYSCLVADTLMTLSDRSKKKVQDIDYDNELLVWDFDNGRLSSAKPIWISRGLVANHYHKVYLSDGTILRFVGKEGYHRLYDVENGCFTQSVKMTGRKTIKQDGSIVDVLGWENIVEDVEYYNIITDFHINCYAEETLTSCRYNNIYPISKDMKYIKDNRQPVPYNIFEGKIEEKYYNGLRISEQTFKPEEIIKYCTNLANLRKI